MRAMGNGVDDLIKGLDAPIRKIVDRLRELVSEVIPDAIEEPDLSAKLIGYTYKPGTYKHLISAIAPHTGHVNLMLSTGAALADQDTFGLLEGTGKKARHIRFTTTADVDRPGIRELLAEADRRTPRP